MGVFLFMRVRMVMVAMRTTLVSSMGIIVKDSHYYDVADKTKHAGDEHVFGLVHDLLIYHPLCGFHKQLSSY